VEGRGPPFVVRDETQGPLSTFHGGVGWEGRAEAWPREVCRWWSGGVECRRYDIIGVVEIENWR
jgi:hypothetical protein